MGCMMMKPVVDGLEQTLAGEVRVIRLDIRDEAGKEALRHYEAPMVPTFILLDGQGVERLRTVGNVPSPEVVRMALR